MYKALLCITYNIKSAKIVSIRWHARHDITNSELRGVWVTETLPSSTENTHLGLFTVILTLGIFPREYYILKNNIKPGRNDL